MPKGVSHHPPLLPNSNSAANPPTQLHHDLRRPNLSIIRVHYGPHEIVPVHDHPDTPTVLRLPQQLRPRLHYPTKKKTAPNPTRPPAHPHWSLPRQPGHARAAPLHRKPQRSPLRLPPSRTPREPARATKLSSSPGRRPRRPHPQPHRHRILLTKLTDDPNPLH